MNDKNQNSNITPDYSFILNQSGPEVKPKKSHKRLLMLVVTIVVAALVVAAGVVVAVNKKVATVQVPAATVAKVANVPAAFLEAINANQDAKAYALLGTDLRTNLAGDTFKNSIGDPFRQYVNLATCKLVADSDNSDLTVTYSCPKKDASTGSFVLDITLSVPDDSAANKAIETINWNFNGS